MSSCGAIKWHPRLIVLFFTLLIQSGWANGLTALESQQLILEQRLALLVSRYDGNALVSVTIKPKVQGAKKLPATPFTLKALTIRDANSMPEVEELTITIITSYQKLLTQTEPLMRILCKDIASKVDFQYESPPAGFASPDKADIPLSSLSANWEGRVTQYGRIVFGLSTVLLLLMVIFFFTFVRSGKKHLALVDQATRNLVNAIQDSSGGAIPTPEVLTRSKDDIRQSGANLDKSMEQFNTIGDDSLLALLTDCYWCEQDGYASYIWSKLHPEKQKAQLKLWPPMARYASYINGKSGNDLGLHGDPAYLNPMPSQGYNNEDLTEVLRSNLGALNSLSQMRVDHLKLSAVERVNLNKAADKVEKNTLKLDPDHRSPLRPLKITMTIQLASAEEEEQLRSLDLALDAKESIPSLLWALELSDEQLEALTSGFNAKALAQAWVGPEDVLTRIKSILPPRKRDLLETYLERLTPSRAAPSHLHLHAKTIELLREGQKQTPTQQESPNVA